MPPGATRQNTTPLQRCGGSSSLRHFCRVPPRHPPQRRPPMRSRPPLLRAPAIRLRRIYPFRLPQLSKDPEAGARSARRWGAAVQNSIGSSTEILSQVPKSARSATALLQHACSSLSCLGPLFFVLLWPALLVRANLTKNPSPRIDPGERPVDPGWNGKRGTTSKKKKKANPQSLGRKNRHFFLNAHFNHQAHASSALAV